MQSLFAEGGWRGGGGGGGGKNTPCPFSSSTSFSSFSSFFDPGKRTKKDKKGRWCKVYRKITRKITGSPEKKKSPQIIFSWEKVESLVLGEMF